eukprot:gene12-16_t
MRTKQELVVWKLKHNLKLDVVVEAVVLLPVVLAVLLSVVLQQVVVTADLQVVEPDKLYY